MPIKLYKNRYNWRNNFLVLGGVNVAQVLYDDGRLAAGLTLEDGKPRYKCIAFHPVNGVVSAINFTDLEEAKAWGKAYHKGDMLNFPKHPAYKGTHVADG